MYHELRKRGTSAMSVATTLKRPVEGSAEVKPILVVDNIVKRFETPDGVLTALDHVSLTVAPGEFLGVKAEGAARQLVPRFRSS